MNPSPLRYPGGKYKLYPYVERLIDINNCSTYMEPFCGGAAIALELLINNKVKRISINDFDYTIYCFWDCVLNHTEEFIDKIQRTSVSLDEWHIQKDIRLNMEEHDSLEIGFSTFFLNRTNRSGIIDKAGPIGGYNQNGNYAIDCRFNKTKLVKQIKIIAEFKNRISLTHYEALDFIDNVVLNSYKSFTFFDPPYYGKGPELYQNSYSHGDHVNLSQAIIEKLKWRKWIVTYDNVNEIKSMYSKMDSLQFGLNYSLQEKRAGTEVMFFSKGTIRPDDESKYIDVII